MPTEWMFLFSSPEGITKDRIGNSFKTDSTNGKQNPAARGIALFETGDRNGALHDWNRVKNLGGFEADGYSENLIYMKGYAEMNRVLGK